MVRSRVDSPLIELELRGKTTKRVARHETKRLVYKLMVDRLTTRLTGDL